MRLILKPKATSPEQGKCFQPGRLYKYLGSDESSSNSTYCIFLCVCETKTDSGPTCSLVGLPSATTLYRTSGLQRSAYEDITEEYTLTHVSYLK